MDQRKDERSILSAPTRVTDTIGNSDTVDLTNATTCIWMNTTGNITVDFVGAGDNILIQNVPAGQWVPMAVKRIYTTGTDVANIDAIGY